MSKWSKWKWIGGAAVVSASVAGMWMSAARGKVRYQTAQLEADETCRAWRAEVGHRQADVCRFDEFGHGATKGMLEAQASLDRARSAFERHDSAGAWIGLASAMAEARSAEAHRTEIGAFIAANITKQVIELMHAHPTEYGPAARAAMLGGIDFEEASHPFEAARIHRRWVLAHARDAMTSPEIVPIGAPSAGVLADQMERDGAAYDKMAAAIVTGDVAGCERAAGAMGRLGDPLFAQRTCDKTLGVIRVAALVHAERSNSMHALGPMSLR